MFGESANDDRTMKHRNTTMVGNNNSDSGDPKLGREDCHVGSMDKCEG